MLWTWTTRQARLSGTLTASRPAWRTMGAVEDCSRAATARHLAVTCRIVVILSTMSLLAASRPLAVLGSISGRNSGASVGSVVNEQMMTESVSR